MSEDYPVVTVTACKISGTKAISHEHTDSGTVTVATVESNLNVNGMIMNA